MDEKKITFCSNSSLEQSWFNSIPDSFNGQTVNFILKSPKVIEPRTYVKKANLKHYRNNTVLLLWQQCKSPNLLWSQLSIQSFFTMYIYDHTNKNVYTCICNVHIVFGNKIWLEFLIELYKIKVNFPIILCVFIS